MARIPTYTAEGGLPAGGTGPQASPAAYAAPARALGNLGETIAQTGSTLGRVGMGVAEQVEKRQEQDDTFWATKEAEDLNRELLKVYDENRENENGADAFLSIAEERLSGRAASAPNPNAAKKLKAAIGDNITSIYSRALTNSSEIRELNKLSETKVSAQKIGEMVNSSDPLSKDLAMMTSQTMIGQRLAAINSLNYSDASKRKLRGAFLEELAISVSPNAPDFAKQLIDTKDIDEARKVTLRNMFDSYESSRNKIAELTFKNESQKALDDSLRQNVSAQIPSDDTYKAIYGKDWEAEKTKDKFKYDTVNSVVGFHNEAGEFSAGYQMDYFRKNIDKYDPEARTAIERGLISAAKSQEGPKVAGWLKQNNKAVQRAFDIANSSKPEERAAKITAANALLLQYQGSAPPVVTDPKERSKYMGRIPGQFHLLSEEDAQNRANAINTMQGPRLLNYMNELAAEFPDDRQRAIVWNDLVSLPQNGIKAEIQFAQMIPDPKIAEVYLNAVQEQKGMAALSGDSIKKFNDALNDNKDWIKWKESFNPGGGVQDVDQFADFKNAIVAYAVSLGQSNRKLDEKGSIKESVKRLVSGSWAMPTVNGQVLPIQRKRSDRNDKPIRTDADAEDIAKKLSLAISMVPMDQVRTTNPRGAPVFPNLEAIQDPMEKLNKMQQGIRSAGFWYTKEDGQGAILYLRDAGGGPPFPLLDKNGNPFTVDYDSVQNTPLTSFGRVELTRVATFIPPTALNQTEIPKIEKVYPYSELIQTPGILGSLFGTKTKTNMPPIAPFWENLSK